MTPSVRPLLYPTSEVARLTVRSMTAGHWEVTLHGCGSVDGKPCVLWSLYNTHTGAHRTIGYAKRVKS